MKNRTYATMRAIRITTAIALFILISAQFLDVYHKLPDIYYKLHPTLTQFAPSLLNIFATGTLIAGASFILFSLLALVFGRAYCSFICPFGIMMDLMRRIAKFPAKNKFFNNTNFGNFCKKHFLTLKFAKAKTGLRIFFTCLAAILIAFGFSALFGLIEPYSLFGKVMAVSGHIAASSTFDGLSSALANRGVYSIPPINGDVSIAFAAFGFSLFVLFAVAFFSALKGRIYCNTLCPVGGFLGLLSKFSIFRLELDKSKCISCRKCERECKAQCINVKSKTLDATRCVLCFNCAQLCPKSAISFKLKDAYKFSTKEEPAIGAAMDRRAFVKSAPIFASIVCAGAKSQEGYANTKYEVISGATPFPLKGHRADKRLTVPPGAKSLKNFSTKCTACQICVSACPSQILKPSISEWSLAGFMQPYMDFDAGFCVHACRDCSRVCPTGAIQALTDEEKLTVKIGTAVFKEELCVVHTDGTDCAACAEHCPVSAIEMIPFKPEKSLFIPHVHSEVCIGCGACEHICPVLKNKAIVIQGLSVHEKSKVFDQSMRLYTPQKKETSAPKETPKPLDNPFPF